jgi:hypothetical protein
MARSSLALLFLFGLVCLASAQTTNSTTTDADDIELAPINSTEPTNSTTEAACPLTEEALAGVNLTAAVTACAGEGMLLLSAAAVCCCLASVCSLLSCSLSLFPLHCCWLPVSYRHNCCLG